MKIDYNEVFTNATVKVVVDAAIGVWGKIKDFFKDVNAHDSIRLGSAYEKYLENTQNKYSKTKTLIYKKIPKDLYTFYECIGVEYNGEVIDTASVKNIIKVNNKVIITGTGGIGKTTLLKHLFLNSIKDTNYIPVLLELRSLNTSGDNISLFDAVFKNLVDNGFKMEEKYFEYSMQEGGYIILFDGFDEVNKEKEQIVTKEIINLAGKYPDNKYIISSRPTDSFVGWNDFVEMQSMNLTKEQALDLISKIEFENSVKQRFYKELDENLYEKYESFASNPLLLTMMLLTFDSRAAIPDKLNDFYEQAFATLFNMHDATKDAYVRDIRCKLGYENFKMVFAYFCFKSYFEGDFEFTDVSLRKYLEQCKQKFCDIDFEIDDFQTDLIKSVCMLIKEGIFYRFSHRSFQEYFAAWYTCKLTDEVQYELLTGWIKESSGLKTEQYFQMLFDLQGEKFNKIILLPGLKLLNKRYENDGFSMKILKYLFKGVSINRSRVSNESMFSFSLPIKNTYLCNIIQMTCNFNRYEFPAINKEQEKIQAEKFRDYSRGKTIYFSKVLERISEEELLESLQWFKARIDFCIDVYKKICIKKGSKKKTTKDILSEI